MSMVLVIGPARSGKSEWAEHLVTTSPQPVFYLATAQADPEDAEWQARIERHRQRRPASWQTLTVPQHLTQSLGQIPPPAWVLVDSLGTWVANFLEIAEADWLEIQQEFLDALTTTPLALVLVAEEVGWGVVPAYPLGRCFRDRLGDLTRRLGAIADTVYLVTGGHALNLSQRGERLPSSLKY